MQALTFDPGAAEEWLRSPSGDYPDFTNAERVGVDETTYGPRFEGFLRRLDDVLCTEPLPGLTLRDDFGQTGLWPIPDGEVLDQGALITIDLTNGIRLATLHQEIRDFAHSDNPRYPCPSVRDRTRRRRSLPRRGGLRGRQPAPPHYRRIPAASRWRHARRVTPAGEPPHRDPPRRAAASPL